MTFHNIKNTTVNMLNETSFFEFFKKEDIYCIYISGSLLEGFGNKESDIDVFIICKSIFDQKTIENYIAQNYLMDFQVRPDKFIITFRYNNWDFDMEVHNLKNITEFNNMIKNKNAHYMDKRYDFLHRLKYGLPIVNENNFFSLKEQVNYNLFNKLPSIHLEDYYAIKSKDIKGAFEEEAFSTSLFMALDLLENCLNAYLSLYGETNPSKKWLLKKINRFQTNSSNSSIDLKDIIRQSYSNIDFYDENNLKIKTIEVLKICQKLNDKIMEVK